LITIINEAFEKKLEVMVTYVSRDWKNLPAGSDTRELRNKCNEFLSHFGLNADNLEDVLIWALTRERVSEFPKDEAYLVFARQLKDFGEECGIDLA